MISSSRVPTLEACWVSAATSPSSTALGAELEDERAHLALRPAGEVADRAEGLGEGPGSAHALLLERALRGARVQDRGEQRLGDGVVQVARDPVPLLHRLLSLVALRLGQREGRPLALADDRAEEQRRERRHGDVELRAERPVVDGLLEERPDVVGRDADRQAGRDRDRQRGAGRPESEGRPDQRRKHHVGHRLVDRDRQHAEGGHRAEDSDALPTCGSAATPLRGRGAQVSISGRTTNPPEVSPSHQVRQKVSASLPSITPPASIDSVPMVALIAVAVPSARSMPPTCSVRSSDGARPDQLAQAESPPR